MDEKARLAKRIARLREDLGSLTRALSRDDLADLLTSALKRDVPIAGSTVKKWEQPTSNGPDPWTLVELARLAKVEVERFVYPADEDIVLRSERIAAMSLDESPPDETLPGPSIRGAKRA